MTISHRPSRSTPVAATRFVVRDRPHARHAPRRHGAHHRTMHLSWGPPVRLLGALVMAVILLALYAFFHRAIGL